MESPIRLRLQRALKDNLPSILSATAVAGVIGSVLLAVKATPEATKDIASAKEDLGATYADGHEATLEESLDYVYDNWTVLQTVKASWRNYIPTTACVAATIACIIGANAIGMRRNAALLAAYTLVDTGFREYKDKVVEVISAQKAQKIDDEVMADKIAKNPPSKDMIVIEGGDQLCYDSLTGRYFKSTAEKIRRAAQEIDARILGGDLYASQNEFYRELGLDPCVAGEALGWSVECRLKVVFSSHITPDDKPVLAIGYEKIPTFNYDKL